MLYIMHNPGSPTKFLCTELLVKKKKKKIEHFRKEILKNIGYFWLLKPVKSQSTKRFSNVRDLVFSSYILHNCKRTGANNKFYCIGCPWNNVVKIPLYRKLFYHQKKNERKKGLSRNNPSQNR